MTSIDLAATDTRRAEKVTERIDAESIVALAEELIRAGGENPGGTEEATVVSLSGALAAIGARIEVDEVAPGRSNLTARLGGDGTGNGGVLFLGHSDVVPAGAGWTADPFEPRRWGDRLIGRGSSDMKGGLASLVVAMNAVHAVAPEVPMTLLVTVDEECDAAGAQHYVASEPAGEYTGCVAAEPTGMQIITACRGATNLRLEITGASAFRLVPELDAGPVYGVVTEQIRGDDTAGALLERLADSGAELLLSTLDGIADGSLEARDQPADGISYAPKITPEDAKIDFDRPAHLVDRHIRSVTPDPGAWALFRGERCKLGPVAPTGETGLAPGELRVERRRVLVGTATTAVALGDVQAQGKKRMAATDWARGTRIEQGEG